MTDTESIIGRRDRLPGHRNESGWDITASAGDIERWRDEAGRTVRWRGGDADAVSVIRLGVSELLSNVVKHAGDPRCRLELHHVGPTVRVRLFDHCARVPMVTVPDWDAEGGRGLWLLREMTGALGCTRVPGGKWVWFAVPLGSDGS
ncbi:ATP-binding protein [Streptomyces alkaliphilus]|uniref:ATP-binding protein n=1 Tax=Streptomyces alkaliphilus TaxID=1472722 RepID=A0A7W3TGG8_9ACTN|nr:ATP-binding protein [Streptomyces alkaliphilus]MBB0246317.1 ATP-binding protein [Streptomyces alkaliphilus]MQS09754.1 ATP-binding protein [Streptomyces alkaliphilus]